MTATSQPQLDFDRPPSGVELRDAGMKSVLSHTPEEWKRRLRSQIAALPKGTTFTMDRVVDQLGGRPKGVHGNSIGALTLSMAKAGMIRRTGTMLKAERASLRHTDMPEWVRL